MGGGVEVEGRGRRRASLIDWPTPRPPTSLIGSIVVSRRRRGAAAIDGPRKYENKATHTHTHTHTHAHTHTHTHTRTHTQTHERKGEKKSKVKRKSYPKLLPSFLSLPPLARTSPCFAHQRNSGLMEGQRARQPVPISVSFDFTGIY